MYTSDVPTALERALAAGAAPMRPADVMPWGQTIAYVADIDGFLVELSTTKARAIASNFHESRPTPRMMKET